MYRAGVTLLVVAVINVGRWDVLAVAIGWYEPQVSVAYMYEHNDTNLTIFCNTTACDSPFLASGMMISIPQNTQFLTSKVNYSDDMYNDRKNYTHELKRMLTGAPGAYVNGSVTCWGSNGTFGAKTFLVKSMINTTAGNTSTSIIHFVQQDELVENPAYFRRSNHRAFMIVILTQVVFVVFIINVSFIWSWTFKRHKR
ncbi:membrane protein UL120 [Human betaherpesvirus 5]|uniref:Membrane protein UL120 n=1 Tax=Human cytomegalovirus TaxID=10359 RepID=A0A0G2TWU2_HCMV|nr:membrane protein UL120 [Human betaherpesvirus 5]AKI13172.1 membrane protein UL120 [Human betaherpesvirus 5]AKI13845.1 membrane protein UL120 [Human betaherpesvirus 5]AKI15520.1 membrane protein UL120 [Human betaherpesvirus 5]AKI17688.1 membrane protein UL120 [Human betaherpesvirus 5]